MSVLNFPRIYFKGHMFWNPPTGNNNDMFPLYDAVNMKMNWPFLAHYNITPENAPQLLLDWMISTQSQAAAPDYVRQAPPNSQNPAGMMPGEWDLFGDNGCGTVAYGDTLSTVIGGELPGGGYVDSDPLIALPYNLYGNSFGSETPTPARFVDVSPWQNTFTALYFDRLVLGNEQCGLTATRQYRMLDRFLNFNWGAFGGLLYVTATWQTCFPKANLKWLVGDSVLLKNLQEQMDQQNAKGLMFRFCSYMTAHDKNGIFNDQPPVNTGTSLAGMQALYKKALGNPADIFFNPAYSCTSGVLGLWFDDEYPTAPSGPRLVPIPGNKLTLSGTPVNLGVISAQLVNDTTLSLDLMNTFPFAPKDTTAAIPEPVKLVAGDYDIGVGLDDDFTRLASFKYTDYAQEAFDQRAGILDLAVNLNADQKALLDKGPLVLQQRGSGLQTSVQQTWTAEVIESGSFIDVNETKTLNIMVQKNGKPAKNLDLLVAEYNNPYLLGTSSYYLGTRNDPDFVLFNSFKDPVNNTENLPQFEDSPSVTAQATEGAGRKLRAFASTEAAGESIPVMYKTYRETPAGINLGACLRFEDRGASVIRNLAPDGQAVEYDYKRITTDANGIASVTVTGVNPGFPTLRFFPDEDGKADIVFSFTYLNAWVDFLAPLRVLPNEEDLKQAFVDQWNKVYLEKNPGQAIWDSFIYPQIFEIYYYLYPIMGKYMPLNNLQRIEGAVDQLIRLVSKPYQEESTLAMPITRDMPQGRRAVLELWAQKLVQPKYPPVKLSMADYDKLNIQ